VEKKGRDGKAGEGKGESKRRGLELQEKVKLKTHSRLR